MRESPILFSGAMVRAILDGRKIQTRRVVKGFALELLQPDNFTPEYVALPENAFSPYGFTGDRLWVRETWSCDFANYYPFDRVWYAADDDRHNDIEVRDRVRGIFSPESSAHVPFRWHPSIHMPRDCSRITLEVTGVRIDRLRDINEADAIAEGIITPMHESDEGEPTYAYAYRHLWDSLNGARGYGWDTNPWVWVVEFRRVLG